MSGPWYSALLGTLQLNKIGGILLSLFLFDEVVICKRFQSINVDPNHAILRLDGILANHDTDSIIWVAD